jgi:WD40 repeat protein
MRTFPGHTGFVEAVAFTPDGKTLVSGSADGTVRLWDALTGKQRRSFEVSGDQVGAVACSPDGRWVAAGDYSGRVRLRALGRRKGAREWEKQGRVVGMAFGPGSDWLAWGSYNGAYLCRFGDGDEVAVLAERSPKLFNLAISPDGQLLALALQKAEARLYRLGGRRKKVSLEHGQRRGCWDLAFTPDGRMLALALAGGAQLWDVEEGRLLHELTGHEDIVSGVACSGDGKRLATCSWDGTARLYELSGTAEPRLVGSYDWEVGKLFDVAFSPDGTLAAVGGDRGDYLAAWDVE